MESNNLFYAQSVFLGRIHLFNASSKSRLTQALQPQARERSPSMLRTPIRFAVFLNDAPRPKILDNPAQIAHTRLRLFEIMQIDGPPSLYLRPRVSG